MRFDSTHIALAVLAVLLALFVVYLLMKKNKDGYDVPPPKEREQHVVPKNSNDNVENSDSIPTMILFYGNNCSHCQRMAPAWKEATKTIEEKTQGKVRILEFESANPEAVKSGVQGFPTIRLYPQGYAPGKPMVEYKGNRTANSFISFALSGGQSS